MRHWWNIWCATLLCEHDGHDFCFVPLRYLACYRESSSGSILQGLGCLFFAARGYVPVRWGVMEREASGGKREELLRRSPAIQKKVEWRKDLRKRKG